MAMTTAELESLRDSLTDMNTQLDYLINRVNTLELNETPKGQYFEQLKSSFEGSPECCSCDGGDEGSGSGDGGEGDGSGDGGEGDGSGDGGDDGSGSGDGDGSGGSGDGGGTDPDPDLDALVVTVDYTEQGFARIANENPISSGNAIVRGTVNFSDAVVILKISPEHVDKPPTDIAESGFTYGYLQYGSFIPDFDEYTEYLATNHGDGTWSVILPANLRAGRYPICVQATHAGRVANRLPAYPSNDGNIYLWRDQFLQVYIAANVSLNNYATPVARTYPNNIEDSSGRAEQFFPTILGYRDYELASAISAFTSLANDTIGIHYERNYSSIHYAKNTVTHRVFSRTMSAELFSQSIGYQVKKYDYSRFSGVYTMSNEIPPTPTTPEYVAGVIEDTASIGSSITFWTPNSTDRWVNYVDNVASEVCMYLTPLLIAEE